MAIQLSTTVRNGRLDSIEANIGASPTMELRSGPQPANCAAGDSGTLLASIVLPADWLANASNGSKVLAGTWSGAGVAAGTIAHFRVKASSVCHMQGSVTATGGGGDVTLDNVVVANAQVVNMTAFTLTDGNP